MKNSKQKIRNRALAVLLALLMVIGSHPMQNYSALAATTGHQDVYTITVKTGEAGSETPVKDAKVTVNILSGSGSDVIERTTGEDGVAVFQEITDLLPDDTAAPVSFGYTVVAAGYVNFGLEDPVEVAFADKAGNLDVTLKAKQQDTSFQFEIPNPDPIKYAENATFTNTASSISGMEDKFPTYSITEGTDCAELSPNPDEPGTLIIKKAGTVKVMAELEERTGYLAAQAEYTLEITEGDQEEFYLTYEENKLEADTVLPYPQAGGYQFSTQGGSGAGGVTYALKDENGVLISGMGENGEVDDTGSVARIDQNGMVTVEQPCIFILSATKAGEENKYKPVNTECFVVVKRGGARGYSVTVSDPDGQCIKGATVTASIEGTDLTAQTDADGIATFNFSTYLTGKDEITVTFRISAYGYEDMELTNALIMAAHKNGNTDISMTAIEQIEVSGMVLGDDGKPVVNAEIQISGYQQTFERTTDKNGRYESVTLYQGREYTFQVKPKDTYFPKTWKGASFQADTKDYNLTVKQKPKDTSFGFRNGAYTENAPKEITYGQTFPNPAASAYDLEGKRVKYKVEVQEGGNPAGENVVEIDEDGWVTALNAGKVKITASLEERTQYLKANAEYYLTVSVAENGDFEFPRTEDEMTYGDDGTSIPIMKIGEGYGNGKITYSLGLADDSAPAANPEEIAKLDVKNGRINVYKAGKVKITAVKAGDTQYDAISSSYTLTIHKGTQQLAFDTTQHTVVYTAGGTYQNTLTGAMGTGPLTYEIAASENGGQPCAKLLDEKTGEIELLGYGTVIVTAIKAGDECYKGDSLQYTLTIERAAQSALKFAQSTPDKVTFNRNNNTYNLTTIGGNGTGAITYEVISGTEAAAVDRETGELSIKKPGTFTVRATKAQDNQYNAIWTEHTITVDKDTQVIAFETPMPGNLIYGNAFSNPVKEVPDTSDLNGKGYGTGVITYSIVSGEELASVDSMGKLTFADATVGTVVVKAEKAGDEYYYPTEQTYTLRVDYLTPPQVPYTIAGSTLNASGWYTGNATIAAPEGYQISESNKLTGNLWSDTLIVTQEGGNPKTVYLKNDQGITDAIDITQDKLLIDKTNPEGLSIRYSTSVLSTVIEALTFGFYRAPVTVTLEAADTTSGIDSFTYSYELQTGASTVNEGAVNVVVGRERMAFDGNTASYSFEIPPQFRGQVSFTAADVSGRETSFADDQILVTDAISPTADITYNDPVQTAGGVSYYDGTIQAAISVTEANFYSEDVTVTISKDGGAPYAVQPDWTTGGGDVHTGTFDIQEDGDYIVTVEYQDRSGNEMNVYTSEQLTVDMTQPVISVEGIQHASANREEKIGFIVTVEDTNLDREAFVPLLMATLRNQDGKFETVDLSEKGSVQTVTEGSQYQYVVENLDADAIYTLTCSARDFAGNEITDMVAQGSGEPLPQMRFSVNREGSTYDIDEATRKINGTFVKEPVDIAIYEINADPLSNLKITLFKNDRTIELVENTDYQVRDLSGEGQWYQYEYRIPKALFMDDGVYRIVTHTQDAAGNVAENTLDTKNTEIGFGVDKTNPNLIFTNLEDETTYPVENMEVVMDISDNLKLESVVAYLDDEECRSWSSEEILLMTQEQDDFSFGIPGDSIRAHSVRVVSTDAAGNAAVSQVQNFYVTTNRWVQFYNNKPLFFGAIAGVVVMLGGAVAVVILVSRRRQNANTNYKK